MIYQKGNIVQRGIQRMLIIGYLLVGIGTTWYIIASQPFGKKEVKQIIQRNKANYVRYIKSLTNQWHLYCISGPFGWIGARIKLSKEELKYIDVAGPFFENEVRVEKEARAIGTEERDIDYLVNLITCYRQQGSKKGDLPKIYHEKNIENLSLPADVAQSTLKKYPDKLSTLVKRGKISDPRYYRNVALNIFVRFLVEKKLLP